LSGGLRYLPSIVARDKTVSGGYVAGVHQYLKNPCIVAIIGDCSNIWGVVDGGLLGDVSRLTGDITGVTGNCSNIWGSVTKLTGFVGGLKGDVSRLIGNWGDVYGDCSGVASYRVEFNGIKEGLWVRIP
jgi:hypothetical protein